MGYQDGPVLIKTGDDEFMGIDGCGEEFFFKEWGDCLYIRDPKKLRPMLWVNGYGLLEQQ
jgi:hypothetical protein